MSTVATFFNAGFMSFARWTGKCRECRTIARVEQTADEVRPGWYIRDHFTTLCVCGKPVKVRMVVGRVNDARKCDARCMGAHGGDCECSCGGENHGIHA